MRKMYIQKYLLLAIIVLNPVFLWASLPAGGSPLNGIYTIDPNGSGANNYNSFSAAVSDLNSGGVDGNVYFMVADGIYNEQIEIGPIAGASDTSMIVFRAANDTNVVLQYSATSSTDNWVVKLAGAKYVVFSHIKISAQGNSYGRVFLFDGNNEHNMIDSTIIETKVNAINYNHAPIIMTTGGSNFNIIRSNIIIGGSAGIYMQGSSSLTNKGNIIFGNQITDFSGFGIYAAYTDSIIVDKNAIYYPTGSGSPKGIYLNYVTNTSEIAGNHIVLNAGNAIYGISVSGSAPSYAHGLIANNFVSCDGGSNTYGIRLASVTNYDVFYNSVNVEGVNSGAALYHSGGGSNVSIMNNIFSNTDGNYGFYTTSPSGIYSADYNCIFHTAGVFAYWNGNRNSLADLQTASGKFANSIEIDPDFFSFTDLHIDNDSLDGVATPLARVQEDIDGDMRDATNPDIGADEFTPFVPFVEQTDIAIMAVKNGSASWTDYDNDGDLDLLVSGDSPIAGVVTKLYQNNAITSAPGANPFTEQTSISFTGVSYSSIEWADYDNDGDLDLLLTGTTNGNASGAVSKIYKNNSNNTFTEQTSISLTAVYKSSVAWGDYDNDGDLDILLTGMSSSSTPIAKLYRNDVSTGMGFTEQTSISFTGVSEGSVAWGDYDNDGLLDILLTGNDGTSEVAKVYKNTPASAGQAWSFAEQTGIVLTPVKKSAVLWADYDNDADLDILITGNNNGVRVSKVYQNEKNGIFLEQTNLNLIQMDNASLAMADFDNDGHLDLLISGETDTGMYVVGYPSDTSSEDIIIDQIAGAVDAGDYDNDGDLDILLIGEDNSSASNAKVYKSVITADNVAQTNIAPNSPTNLMHFLANDSVYFIWSPAVDNATLPLGMTYNIRIGTAANKFDIKAARADTMTGYNRLAEMGEITDTFYAIKINDSLVFENDIYWSVQAVDQGFEASNFSPVDTISMNDFFTNQPVTTVPNLKLGSSAWGDFDNDGHLDLLISGIDPATSTVVTKVYKNNIPNGDLTEQTNISLTGVCNGDVAWVDYDNDGDLDIVISGNTTAQGGLCTTMLYKNNGAGASGTYTFTEQTAVGFADVYYSSFDWGDFDNDGDLDFLLSGKPQNGGLSITYIYENNGTSSALGANNFSKRDNLFLQGASYGESLWADYDNDGDLDVLIMGYQSGVGYFTKLYKNDKNQKFVEQMNLEKLSFSSAAWGDYDNDGDLDLLIAGKNENYILKTKVYQNNINSGGGFIDQAAIVLPGIQNGDVAWIDANNDGWLDILLSGNPSTGSIDSSITELYVNNGLFGNNTFSEQFDTALMDVKNSSISFADIDRDGDMDLLIQGEDFYNNALVQFYGNNSLDSNELPSKPTGLVSQVVGDSIRFSWDKSVDSSTPSPGLSYNLRIGSTINGMDILSPQSEPSGFRKIVNLGAIRDTAITIKAPLAVSACSKLYWSVQAIDNSFSGSEFSDTDSLQNAFSTQTTDVEIALHDTAQISVTTNSCSAVTYLWSPSSSLSNANVQSPEAFPSETTVYTVQLTQNGITTYDSLKVYVNQFTPQDNMAISKLYSGSIIWGDYDNDHDLDFLLAGWSPVLNHTLKLYNNNGNNDFVEQANIGLPAFEHQAVVWGDYDNDGDLDILMSGYQNGGVAKIYRNDGPSAGSGPYVFSEQTAISIAGLSYGDVQWADFDNDGYLDIIISGLISGYPNYLAATKIYKNEGPSSSGSFTFTEQTNLSITGFWHCSIACGDYDNDGFTDFVISGDTAFKQSATIIYKNKNGLASMNWDFSPQNIPLIGASYGSVEWGDYNNDGNIDLLVSGNNSTNIYKNNADNTFTRLSAYDFVNLTSRSSAWGDYDNDGDLDFIISGVDATKKSVTQVYRNEGMDVFTLQNGLSLNQVEGCVAWADYDNDGDLDFVLTGKSWNATTSMIYRNNLIKNNAPQVNTLPSAPTNLQAHAVDTSITFSWNASADASTPTQCLTYNLLVGSSLSAMDLKSPQSDTITGFHRVVSLGNVRDTIFTLHIDSVSKIYWAVQAIDQGFEASQFSVVDSLALVKEVAFTASSNNLSTPPFNVSFTNNSLGYNKWSWSFGDANFSNQKNPTHTYLYNGSYTVTLYATDTITNETDTAEQTIVCSGGTNNPCAFLVQLTQPQSAAMVCQGDSVRLSATPMNNVTYVWTHNGAAIPNSNDSVFYAVNPGFYMVVVSSSSCSVLSDNYFVLANYPSDPLLITTVGSIAPCSNDSLKLEASSGFNSYLWNTGATTSSIYTHSSGYYSVEAVDANSCHLNSEEVVINTSLANTPNICVVGVDAASNHNVVEWVAESSAKIDSFRVYKETTISNQYDYMGSVVYNSMPSFEDVNSDVAVRQYQYRISAIDTCGKESPLSLPHKTMHLQVNAAINNHWNLIWQAYKGLNFGSYKIYRGTDSLNMSLLTTVSSNVTAYTDLNNPTGDVYYQIEIESTTPCQAKSYATSRSNLFNTKNASGVGINTQNAMVFNAVIFPNPSKGVFMLKTSSDKPYDLDLHIYNVLGAVVYHEKLFVNTQYQKRINLNSFAKGVYSLRLTGKMGLVYYTKLIIR